MMTWLWVQRADVVVGTTASPSLADVAMVVPHKLLTWQVGPTRGPTSDVAGWGPHVGPLLLTWRVPHVVHHCLHGRWPPGSHTR